VDGHRQGGIMKSIDKLKWLLTERHSIKNAETEVRDREDLLSPGISACLGCGAELGLRIALKVLGRNTVLAIPPGCMGGVGVVGYGPTTGAKIPVFFPLLDNIASMLSGIKRQYNRKGKKVHVLAYAGDGGTADVGFQSLSGAAERGESIIYICYDNEGYMNTGIQRSGTTPYKAWTTTTPVSNSYRGKPQANKYMALIMAMHELPYVATASIAYVEDYINKLKKAAEVEDGLSYIHLFTPCPVGWKFPPDKTIEVARLAVETNFFPLWEAEYGKIRFTKRIWFKKPVKDYLKAVGKYSHLTEDEIREIQQVVDNRYRLLKSLAK